VILDTPQRPPGARKFMLIAATVALLVVGLVGAGIAYNLNAGPGPDPKKSPSTPPTPIQSQAAGAAACPPTVTKLARCSQTVECLDADKQAVPCTGVHTWEVFAYGDLAQGSQVKTAKDSPVDEVCSFKTLLLMDLRAVNLKVDALLPTASEQQAGPTVFRCLAGNPPGTFTGQQLRVSRTSPAPSGAGRRS
jgi:eukaryotic-like serine/threonine-protein kinase